MNLSNFEKRTYLNNSGAITTLGATATVITAQVHGGITSAFNQQCTSFITNLGNESADIASKLSQNLSVDSGYTQMRSEGVRLAWKYEQADVEMGGRGSSNWNASEREQIRTRGTVRGAEGHHQKNVADHPESQTDPDNIKFYRNRQEHLQKGHGGNFQNESDADMIDKEQMLRRTNFKRVVRNEITGIALSAAIGFGIGLSIGMATSFAQNGISPESIKIALIDGGKSGVMAAAQSAITYGIGRAVSCAIQGILGNVGIELSGVAARAFNAGILGAIAIIANSVISFIILKRQGKTTKDTMLCIGKQALLSFSILAISVVLICVNAPVGIIVAFNAVVGLAQVSYSIYKIVANKKFVEKLRDLSIDYNKPVYGGV